MFVILYAVKKFEDAMTSEEKAKLYQAIDYEENTAPTVYPQAFVDTSSKFVLKLLEIEVRDDSCSIPRVLSTKLEGVKCRLETRAASSGVKYELRGRRKIDD